MWPHKSVDLWALVVGIAGLFLAYPLAVLGHIHAQWWRDRFAERSLKSLNKRIEKLEKQATEYEGKYTLLSEGEEEILKALEGVALLVGLGVAILTFFLLLGVRYIPQLSDYDARRMLGLGLVSAFATFLVEVVIFGRFARFRIRRSPSYRKQIQQSIKRLKERLAVTTTE
jgi:hypothetical protein